MAAPYPRFLLPAGWGGEQLAARLAASWTVTPEPATRVLRHYLDSADRCMAANGATLQAKLAGDVLGLVYEELASGKPVASCRAHRVPERVADVPAGVLRDLLEPIVGDRPLVSIARLDGEVRALRVGRDGDTVARLVVESGRCSDGRGGAERELAARVTLVGARGRERAAQALARYLAGELGLAHCPATRLAQVLAALERAAG